MVSSTSIPSLDRLPTELIDRILLHSDPIDIARFSRVASFAYQLVYGPQNKLHLWHRLHMAIFDPIPSSLRQPAMGRAGEIEGEDVVPKLFQPALSDWPSLVQDRILLRQTLSINDNQKLIAALSKNYPDRQRLRLYNLLFDLLNSSINPSSDPNNCLSLPSTSPLPYSRNIAFLQHILANPPAQACVIHYSANSCLQEPIFALRPTLNDPLVAAAAKLHTIYGLTSLDLDQPRARGIARESCYALANYQAANLFGPFMPDHSGRVNWAHLEALGVVVGLNLHYARQLTRQHHLGPLILHQRGPEPPDARLSHPHRRPEDICWPILDGLTAARPYTQLMHPAYVHPAYPWPPSPAVPVGRLDLNHYDWAGVAGRWSRVVCFLDYRDLHAYNFLHVQPRVSLDEHTEAVRMMTLELEVVSIGSQPDNRHPVPPGLVESPSRPPIFFTGTSSYNLSASSSPVSGQTLASVRGVVSCTADGEVRWSVVSTLGGVDRWSSEGIQVGGVRSRWGVLGVWTDVDRTDVEGPAGPFYFFKTAY